MKVSSLKARHSSAPQYCRRWNGNGGRGFSQREVRATNAKNASARIDDCKAFDGCVKPASRTPAAA
jgi:hypothetical protein